jgi:hypothetical protein
MENKHNKIYQTAALSVVLLLLSSFIMVSGNKEPLVERIEQYLQKLRTEYGAEKLYLHLDKPYYSAGETIWLKAYLQDASQTKPVSGSQVIYVDLISTSGKPAQRLVLKSEGGKAASSITLPDSLATGTYRLTAYTNWMRNFGEVSFYHREVQIFNPADQVKEETTKATTQQKIDLQFFPEGGDLVTGLPSKVAFKAIDPQGQGVTIQGTLYDQDGSKVQAVKSAHLGMGVFELTPEQGKRYFLKVPFSNGTVIDYPLPVAKAEGYSLAVDEVSDKNQIRIQVQTNVPNAKPLLLTGISQNQLLFTETINWQGNKLGVNVPKDKFPTGIVHFTLSETSGEPLAERLAFVNHNDQLQLAIHTNQQTYGTREKVTMEITAKNAKGQPVATDFSLAVTDDELVKPAVNTPGIVSHLLLTSDLKGYVEEPNYYFTDVSPEKQQALRYLMMTQGWRRFGWQQMIDGQLPQLSFAKETDLTIRGKLLTTKGKPVANGEVILYLKDQHQTFIVEETNEQGEFAFEGFNFSDTVSLVIQGTDSRGRRDQVEVVMDEKKYVPAQPQIPVPGAEMLLASTSKEYITASSQQINSIDEAQSLTLGDIVLKDIVVESKAHIEEPFRLHNQADVVLRGNQLPVAPSGNILEVLQGRVAGLQIQRRGFNDFRATIRGQGQPLYLIDGVPVDASAMGAISAFDVDRIEVIKNAAGSAIYGGRASGGVIAVYTKRGGNTYEEIDETGKKFIIIHRAGGFAKTRQFYSPKYDGTADTKLPDLRTTLYWNPNVKTDANGKALLTFYTADRNTKYRAILEGVSPEGTPGRSEFVFGVTDTGQASGK